MIYSICLPTIRCKVSWLSHNKIAEDNNDSFQVHPIFAVGLLATLPSRPIARRRTNRFLPPKWLSENRSARVRRDREAEAPRLRPGYFVGSSIRSRLPVRRGGE